MKKSMLLFGFLIVTISPAAHATHYNWMFMNDGTCLDTSNLANHLVSPEAVIRKYPGCAIDSGTGMQTLFLDCSAAEISGKFIFTESKEVCDGLAKRLKKTVK